MKRLWTPLFAAALAMLPAACTTNPATGRTIFTLLPKGQEIQIGAEAAPGFTQEYGGKVPSDELQRYVTDIGLKMAAETEADYPTYPWEFTLLNSDVVNAFALPGGKVFFSRGLAERLTSEAQMAGVIGHEIGHVTAQHGNQRISSHLVFNSSLAIAAVIVDASDNDSVQQTAAYGIPALALGGNLVLLKFGRDEELEADRLGVRYMSRVGYNPRGQLEVMQVLKGLSAGGGQPEILSTHPDPDARIDQIRRMLQGEYAGTQGNPQYQDYAERYRERFLTPMSKVPAPPPTQHGMSDPATWCAVCAAAEGDAREAGWVLCASSMRTATARSLPRASSAARLATSGPRTTGGSRRTAAWPGGTARGGPPSPGGTGATSPP